MSNPFTQKLSRPLILLLALSLATSLVVAAFNLADTGQLWSPLDDAFIYAQYAHEMARGNFYAYGPGERMTTGATSPLYPWVLVPAFWLGLGGERITWWWFGLGVLWRLATSLFTFALVRRWTRDVRPAWAAAVLALLNGNYNWAVSSGMETGLMSTLLLGSLWSGQRWLESVWRGDWRGERGRRWAFGLLLALLAVSRPEGTATAVAGFVLIGWWLRRRGRRARAAWGWLALAFLPVALWILLVRLETGTLRTSSLIVKTSLFLPGFTFLTVLGGWFEGIRQTVSWDLLGTANLPMWGWVAAAAGCAALVWRGGRGWRGLAGRLPVVWLIGLAVPALSMGLLMHMARYQAAHLPLLVALGTYGVWRLGVLAPRIRAMAWGGLGILAAALFACGLVVSAEKFARQTEDMYYLHRPVSRWFVEHTAPGTRIGVTDAGIIPYLTGRPIVDFVGLTTPEMVGALINGPGTVWHLLERMDARRRPEYSATFPTWFDATPLGKPVADFRIDQANIVVEPEMAITEWGPPLPWAEKRVPQEARVPKALRIRRPAAPSEAVEDEETSPGIVLMPRVREAFPETTPGSFAQRRRPRPARGEDAVTSSPRSAQLETRPVPAAHETASTVTWSLMDFVDMADPISESEHEYRYENEAKWDLKRHGSLMVAQASPDSFWRVADGGRGKTDFEEFRLSGIDPARTLRLAVRTYSDFAHSVRVLIEGVEVGVLAIPKNGRSGVFDIVVLDIPPVGLNGVTSPRVRFELIREGQLDEYPLYTTFALWALQPVRGTKAVPSELEKSIEDRIVAEGVLWADSFRKKYDNTIPIDIPDQVLFQIGWDTPSKDKEDRAFRWGLGPKSVLMVPFNGVAKGEEAATTPTKPSPPYTLEAEVEPYIPPTRRGMFWNWILVRVNDKEVGRWKLEPRRRVYRCVVPGSPLRPHVNTVEFLYGRTYVPAEFEPGSTEKRAFGAKFYAISLRPEPAPPESLESVPFIDEMF